MAGCTVTRTTTGGRRSPKGCRDHIACLTAGRAGRPVLSLLVATPLDSEDEEVAVADGSKCSVAGLQEGGTAGEADPDRARPRDRRGSDRSLREGHPDRTLEPTDARAGEGHPAHCAEAVAAGEHRAEPDDPVPSPVPKEHAGTVGEDEGSAVAIGREREHGTLRPELADSGCRRRRGCRRGKHRQCKDEEEQFPHQPVRPRLTTRLTVLPPRSTVPALGCSEITRPRPTVE